MSADVLVVGAGAIGLAVALELRRAGVEEVTVVDRHPSPGMGSTGRANGGVRAQFATEINIRFSQHTIQALAELDVATAGRVGYRPIGYLFMAGTAASADALLRSVAMQRSLGVPVEWMTAHRVEELAPLVSVRGLRSAAFCASDGIIDPSGVTAALCAEGRRLGVHYVFDHTVSGIERSGDVALVQCGERTFEAAYVVNAAGPFAREVAAMEGVDLPVAPRRRNLVVTEPIPDAPPRIPMCVDMDTGVLIRREGPGVLIAYSDPGSPVTLDTSFDDAYLDDVAARLVNRFPAPLAATIDPRKCWAGLYPETADHHAIIDAPSDAPWFIQCAGFGGHGIMHSLAAGRAVAELVTAGRCTSFDLAPLRLRRFADKDLTLTVETAVL
ncbi:MAG: FAD-binding oxidoreductase [Candidatus Dormibacteraeota bacterium]|nr:FAD-binding oxidoreductase [Candidatus Dormibacteraeota bacterium]